MELATMEVGAGGKPAMEQAAMELAAMKLG